MRHAPTTSTYARDADTWSIRLRVVAALLLTSGFVIYSLYGRHFYADFLVECQHVWGANLNDADDGTFKVDWLYAFLVAAVPLTLASRLGLQIMIGLLLAYDGLGLSSLSDPYTGSDCGIHSGNDQDFTGNYILFSLGYIALLPVFYAMAIVALGARAVRFLRRRLGA